MPQTIDKVAYATILTETKLVNLRDVICDLSDVDCSDTSFELLQQRCGRLLTDTRLVAFGTSCRLREIEFYCTSTNHPDPYTHGHEIQSLLGRWYAHRVGKGFKGGSFKGIDFTFGRDGAYGGMLIRSIETADGSVVCGPSLCVDHLIRLGGFSSVAELDAAVAGRPIWDAKNPLHLVTAVSNHTDEPDVYRTARVGLNGFTVDENKLPWRYLLRRYRFLSRPRSIKKGRVHLIIAMHRSGSKTVEIRDATGSPLAAIQRHIENFESSQIPLEGIANLPAAKAICALERLDASGDARFR